jgi:hypothetical protein
VTSTPCSDGGGCSQSRITWVSGSILQIIAWHKP